MERTNLQNKLLERYPFLPELELHTYSQRYNHIYGSDRPQQLTRLQRMYLQIMNLIEVLKPYVRITRIIVTYVAPLLLMIMYVTNSSMRTKRIWRFIRNFKSDRTFSSGSSGIMELTQLNDMFWVRLTQVIATVIGY